MDTVVFQPMDSLFDWMLADDGASFDASEITLQWPNAEQPKNVNAFFTRDCKCSAQGFVVLATRFFLISNVCTRCRQHGPAIAKEQTGAGRFFGVEARHGCLQRVCRYHSKRRLSRGQRVRAIKTRTFEFDENRTSHTVPRFTAQMGWKGRSVLRLHDVSRHYSLLLRYSVSRHLCGT